MLRGKLLPFCKEDNRGVEGELTIELTHAEHELQPRKVGHGLERISHLRLRSGSE